LRFVAALGAQVDTRRGQAGPQKLAEWDLFPGRVAIRGQVPAGLRPGGAVTPAMKPARPIANFCAKSASNAPMNPSKIAKVSCSSGVGSLTMCEARVTPAANPIAATQSQKSLRPKSSTTAPITTLRMGMDAFMDVLLPRPAPDQRLLYPHPIVILSAVSSSQAESRSL